MEPSDEINNRGNKITRKFCQFRDRYHYDFEQCTKAKGWKQYDTRQDASYFGVWVHVAERKVLTFCEGDETLVECPTLETFKAELDDAAEFYGDPPPMAIGIDMDGAVTHYFDERPRAE